MLNKYRTNPPFNSPKLDRSAKWAPGILSFEFSAFSPQDGQR